MQEPDHTNIRTSTLTRDTREWLDCVTNPDHVTPAQRTSGFERTAIIPTFREVRVSVPPGYTCSLATGLHQPSHLSIADPFNATLPAGLLDYPAWVTPSDAQRVAMFATGVLCVRPTVDSTSGEPTDCNPFNVERDGLIYDLTDGSVVSSTVSNSIAARANATSAAYPFWQPGLEDLASCRYRVNGSYARVQITAPELNTAWEGTAMHFTDAAMSLADNVSDLIVRANAVQRFNQTSEKYGSGIKVRSAGLYDSFSECDMTAYARINGDGPARNATGFVSPYATTNPDLEDIDERMMIVVTNTGTTTLSIIAQIVMNLEVTGSGHISQYSPCFPRLPPKIPDTFLCTAKYLSDPTPTDCWPELLPLLPREHSHAHLQGHCSAHCRRALWPRSGSHGSWTRWFCRLSSRLDQGPS